MSDKELTWQGKPLEEFVPTMYFPPDPIFEEHEAEMEALIGLLAAAEQRATDAEARAERLAAACKIGLGVIVRSYLKGKEPRDAIAVLTSALAAPATQPDERAAAERANGDAADVAFAACEALVLDGDIAEARGRAARALLRRREATDGAAKEMT